MPKATKQPVLVESVGDLGTLSLRRMTIKTLKEIVSADPSGKLPVEDLVNAIIQALARKPDGTELRLTEVKQIDSEDRKRLVYSLIALHPEWFRTDATSEIDDEAKGIIRDPLETEEAFLVRGYRASVERLNGSIKRSVEQVSLQLSGASDHLKKILSPGLIDNLRASQRLADVVKRMSGTWTSDMLKNADGPSAKSATASIRQIPYALDHIKIAPNPVFKTNEILSEVTSQIGEMRDLASATAEMQQSLNDTASTALTEFSKGAEKSARAARNGLIIAGISALLALASIFVSIYLGHQQAADSKARDIASMSKIQALIVSEQQLYNSLAKLQHDNLQIAPPATPVAPTSSDAKSRHPSDRKSRRPAPTE